MQSSATTSVGEQGLAPLSVALVRDFPEEQWFSMDVVADALESEFESNPALGIHCSRVCAPWLRIAERVSGGPRARMFNADRVLNRYCWYPPWLWRHRHSFEVFHVIDHSYAHLVHVLPPGRTLVTCHDADAFRCLLPGFGKGPLMTGITRSIVRGVQTAARVVCVSESTRQTLITSDLLREEKISVIPNGVDACFGASPDEDADGAARRIIRDGTGPVLLNVSSCAPRKRLDVLLEVFAALLRSHPQAILVRAGGAMTAELRARSEALGVADRLIEAPFLERRVLAALYRRATLALQPSESEGFGLPLAEALACGCPVIASDIDVFHEVGGSVAVYCPTADIDAWTAAASALLTEARSETRAWAERKAAAKAHGERFSWKRTAERMAIEYRAVREHARENSRRG